MKVFLKYIWKSLIEKKLRLFLLMLAIILSVGLFVTSLGTLDIGINSYIKPYIESYENKDVVIISKNGEQFFEDKDLKEKSVRNLVKEIYLSGYYEEKNSDDILNAHFVGREDKYIDKSKIIEGSIDDLNGEKCAISKRISKAKKIKLNDKCKFIIGGKSKELTVGAIFADDGMFYADNNNEMTVLVPYNYLATELSAEGKYNMITANSTGDSLDKSIKAFNKANDAFKAEKLFDEEQIMSQMSSFSSMLYFMLAIVVLMSGIIIFETFKLIITERLSIIGTFLSQGATVFKIEQILLLESVSYGIIGGILGIAFGIGGLKIVNTIVSPLKDYGIYEKLSIDPKYIVYGMIFSIILCVISSIVPIMKIRKLQVKEVILNEPSISYKQSKVKPIIGGILLIISIVFGFIDNTTSIDLSPVMLLFAIIGTIMIMPIIVSSISGLVYKLIKGKCKSLTLAINNLKTSKILLGNITLIIVALLAISIINSLGQSLTNVVKGAYEGMKYDISINGISTIRQNGKTSVDEIIDELKKIDGIDDNSYCKLNDIIATVNKKSISVTGCDPRRINEYCRYLEFDSDKNIDDYKAFLKSDNRGIIASSKMCKELNLKKGDKVKVKIFDKTRELKIVGIVDGKLYQSGEIIIIKNDALESIYNKKGANQLIFNTTKDQGKVKEKIKYLTKKYGVVISTNREDSKANVESNQMLIDVLGIFSYMSVIIAAVGVLNNILLSFIQRKRELAVLSSIGMAKKNRNIMILEESILSVIWAFIISLPLEIIIMKHVTKITSLIGLPFEVSVNYSNLGMDMIVTLIIILLATIPALLKNRKLSIISELKYE